MARKSAFEEAKDLLGGIGKSITGGVTRFAQDYSNYQKQQFAKKIDTAQRVQNFVRNPVNYFNPENTGGFWGSQTAKNLGTAQQVVEKVSSKVPKFNFAEEQAKKIQNPIARPVAQFALSIPESIANTPYLLSQGSVETGRAINQRRPLPEIIGKATQPLEGILNIATLGAGGAVANQVGKQGFKQLVKEGMLQGGKYGLAYGSLSGLERNQNAPTVQQQVIQSIPDTLVGGGTGLIGGGVGTAVFYPLSKAISRYISPKVREFFIAQKQQNGVLTPQQFRDSVSSFKLKDIKFLQWADNIASEAERLGMNISLDIEASQQTKAGKLLRVGKDANGFQMGAKLTPVIEQPMVTNAIVPKEEVALVIPERPVALPVADAPVSLPQSIIPELGNAQPPAILGENLNAPQNLSSKLSETLNSLQKLPQLPDAQEGAILLGSNYGIPEEVATRLAKEITSLENEVAKYTASGIEAPADIVDELSTLYKQIEGAEPIPGIIQERTLDIQKNLEERLSKASENPFDDIVNKTQEDTAITEPDAIPFDQTDEFRMLMENLEKFRNIKEEAPALITKKDGEAPKITDEELAIKALDEFRGYGSEKAASVRYSAEDEQRLAQLAEMKVELDDQIGQISDALRNYSFYASRFGELMNKNELKSLRAELKRSIASIDKEVKGIQKNGEEVFVIAPAQEYLSDDELAMKALEQWRDGVPPIEKTAEEAIITPKDELPVVKEDGTVEPPKAPETTTVMEESGQQEVSQALSKAAEIAGMPDFSKTQEQLFNAIFAKWIGKRDVAKTTGIELAEQFAEIPPELGPEIIRARENPNLPMREEVAQWIKPIAEMYDALYQKAVDAGVNIHYLNNYITHIWEQSPEEVAKAYMAAKTRFNFAQDRLIPTYDEGIQMGLKPKYDHPAQIIAHYAERLDQSIANVEMLSDLKAAGIVVPAGEGVKNPGYAPITAPGIDRSSSRGKIGKDSGLIIGDYYAPRPIANTLNKVFSPDERGLAGKAVGVTAGLSGLVQDVTLSGGLPFTPVNAYTFGQTIKEVTAGVGGLWNSPVLSTKRILSPITSVINSTLPGQSKNFFKNNAWAVKEMQAQNIPLSTEYSIDNLIPKSFSDRMFGEGFKGVWAKAVNRPTFNRFMPMLQVNMYKDIKGAAIKQGKTNEEASKIAGDAVKSFYGVVGSDTIAKRSRAVHDAISTVFFAPKYRESMVRMWWTAAKSAFPLGFEDGKVKLNNPFSLKNRTSTNFLIGTMLTLVGYNVLNQAFNGGRTMSENPPGTEDKLLIPLPDGNIMGIPVLPSVGTIPRSALRTLESIGKGDLPGVIKESKSYLSSLISPLIEVGTNENYFGQPIYEEDDTASQKYQKIGRYLALAYNHPWIEAMMDKYQKNEPGYQTLAKGLELPFRWYTQKSLDNKYYFGNLDAAKSSLSPEAQKVWDKLYPKSGKAQFSDDTGLAMDPTRSKMSNALDRLAHPEIVTAETEAALKTAQEQGTPVNPFYLLTPEQQQTVLLLDTFYPGEPTKKTIQNANMGWLKPFWDAKSQWAEQMQALGYFKSNENPVEESRKNAVYGLMDQGVVNSKEITALLNDGAIRSGYGAGDFTEEEVNKYIAGRSFIEPTPELQSKLDFYNTLPKGTGARSRFLRGNPDVVAFFEAQSQLTNDKRAELGLPAVGGGGGGFGSYQKKPSIKVPKGKAPPKIKLSGPAKSSFKPLKTTSVRQGVSSVPTRTRSYKPAKVNLVVRNNLGGTLGTIKA